MHQLCTLEKICFNFKQRSLWLGTSTTDLPGCMRQIKHTYFLLGFMLGFFLEKNLVSFLGSRLSYLINV